MNGQNLNGFFVCRLLCGSMFWTELSNCCQLWNHGVSKRFPKMSYIKAEHGRIFPNPTSARAVTTQNEYNQQSKHCKTWTNKMPRGFFPSRSLPLMCVLLGFFSLEPFLHWCVPSSTRPILPNMTSFGPPPESQGSWQPFSPGFATETVATGRGWQGAQ